MTRYSLDLTDDKALENDELNDSDVIEFEKQDGFEYVQEQAGVDKQKRIYVVIEPGLVKGVEDELDQIKTATL